MWYSTDTELPISVSGIGFKPTKVIVYLALEQGSTTSPAQKSLFFIEDGDRKTVIGGGSGVITLAGQADNFSITMDSDGFTISCNDGFKILASKTYNYVAIG